MVIHRGTQPPKELMMEELSENIAPYPPSWMNRFTYWVKRLPIPAWLFYTILLIVWELIVFLLAWVGGDLQWGELDFTTFFYSFWGVAILAFHHYLESEIRDALHDSKSLLKVSSGVFSKLEYEFTIMPARPFLVWSMIGLGVGVFLGAYEAGITRLSFPILFQIFNYGLQTNFFLGLSYRLLRLLIMINKLYSSSITINLFDLAPVYVLSALCAKVGLFLLALLYSSLALEPESIADPVYLGGFALFSILPLAAFILPLRGINRRLVNEKRHLISDVSRRLEFILSQIKHAVESDDLKRVGDLETALRAVEREKDLVDKIPTWPWRPATLRVFLSAVFLPIFLWLIQQILDRVLDF
jgi:hypothetical protein